MNIIRLKEQKRIDSKTCGNLLEVINQPNFPFGIVLSDNIQSTESHYHKKAKKCYWMLQGWVEIIVENIRTGTKKELKLNEGDLITFEPFEKHQIVRGSSKNKMATITSPAWHIDDVVMN